MPVVSIHIDGKHYEKFREQQNKSGLVNDLLFEYFQKQDAKQNEKKNLTELELNLKQTKEEAEALQKRIDLEKKWLEEQQRLDLEVIKKKREDEEKKLFIAKRNARNRLERLKETNAPNYEKVLAEYKASGLV